MKIHSDFDFMRRALELAARGGSSVSPNPMVGAVVVRDGKIISQGYHQKFGSDHAEIIALKKIKMKAQGATLYVTLEPCAHYGKTPPCVDAVIRSGVTRVVIAMRDPNLLTCGKSIRKLKRVGIEVKVGVCKKEAEYLNRFFVKHITKKVPYVICKIAQSLDGKISTRKGKQGWITGETARGYVHGLRSQVAAILVGRRTIEIDDPQLNVRNIFRRSKNIFRRSPQKQPLRVVLDSRLKMLQHIENKKFFNVREAGEICFFTGLRLKNLEKLKSVKGWRWEKTENKNELRLKNLSTHHVISVISVSKSRDSLKLREVLRALSARGVSSVLVEGGAEIFRSFAQSDLVDEWHVLVSPRVVGSGGLQGLRTPSYFRHLKLKQASKLGRDYLLVFSRFF